ncbi:imidazole glycerol phosphate synthase subunit HisH [Planctobacterium marinum]|uniref:Imidazole glycerol phosphate synthase subunit HisH n=1 Tax=Planctobacterium marinum TaxID=1631968 RepID=A0AA48HJV2_9ALTE|nr:imidazole glycerol phosphate synthase subunit HisH 2 [Planctobacterium marinum]
MIALVDSNISNIGSIANMLNFLDIDFQLVTQPEELDNCDKIILPGVGAFDSVMSSLRTSGMDEAINEQVQVKGKYYMGICVGAQLLCQSSEEGKLPGFGWLPLTVTRFDAQQVARVPHMGWNHIEPGHNSALLHNMDEEYARFYFLHSYYIPHDDKFSGGVTRYGALFSAIAQRDNYFGVQFHPEKSHKYGMHLFQNFEAL